MDTMEITNNLKDISNLMMAILNASYDGIWLCDEKGTVLAVNSASEKINGISAEDVVGKRKGFLYYKP